MNLLQHEPALRLGCFFAIFFLVAAWEAWAPRRTRDLPRTLRWPNNLGIVLFNTLTLRLLLPAGAVGAAITAEKQGWGLLNQAALPSVIEFLLALVIFDLVIYLQHVMFHAVPALWRLHRMHHADLEFDVTTGARFHPLEIVLSMLLKLAVIAALGPSAIAVLVFEILLNALAMFNHGNIRLPARLDQSLRLVLVTPDMHRVHHSVIPRETNSNFGFNLSLWDRCLGTYRAQPQHGHTKMTIGIDAFRSRHDLRLDRMLIQPFRGRTPTYPINRDR
ncbi:MAG TPA: sterol desaturase [Porticoccaceae bacterium]|nr:sterol desaturase [Porticoccaceae bacterium]